MTATPEPTVIPGRVQVSQIVQVIDQPDVKVFEVDLASKYPGDLSDTADERSVSVMILPDEHTLRLDESADGVTEIVFPVECSFAWTVIANGSKGTVRICLYRRPR